MNDLQFIRQNSQKQFSKFNFKIKISIQEEEKMPDENARGLEQKSGTGAAGLRKLKSVAWKSEGYRRRLEQERLLSDLELVIWAIFYIFLGTMVLAALLGCVLACCRCLRGRRALRQVHQANPGIRKAVVRTESLVPYDNMDPHDRTHHVPPAELDPTNPKNRGLVIKIQRQLRRDMSDVVNEA